MDSSSRRPRLAPGIRPLWRDINTVHLGLNQQRAKLVKSECPVTARMITELDGSRTEAEILAGATAAGVDSADVAYLLDELRQHQLVVDTPRAMPEEMRGTALGERLTPDHLSIDLVRPGQATDILEKRRRATIVIHGAGRVGTPLASLLGAAGVGRVVVVDQAECRLGDCAPGGIQPQDEGRPRGIAAAEAVRRHAPEVDTRQLPVTQNPDLVVLTGPEEPGQQPALQAAGIAHLVAIVRETTAVIGPLVQPGYSTCLRCMDLEREDRDPAWPVLAAQITTRRRGVAEPCDVVLASFAAVVAATQCLAHLEQVPPAAVASTMELALPDWRIERRTWPPRYDCDCRAKGTVRAG